MQAIILCGGKGMRLSALYPDRPKALVPIAGRPFIGWQIAWLIENGATALHFAAGYQAEVLERWLRDNAQPIPVTISAEPAPLGTGGGLKFAAQFVRGDPFFAINGDTLLPHLHFEAMIQAGAESPDALVVIAVTRIREAGRFGTVEFDAERRITAFREKAQRAGGWINCGVYLVRRDALDAIEPGRNLSLETDIFPALSRQGAIRAFPADPPLLDMGTPEGLREMETFLGPASSK